MKKILILLAIPLLFLIGCLPSADTGVQQTDKEVVEIPSESPIDIVKTIAENEFPKWIAMWQNMIPDFAVSGMTASDEKDITYYYEGAYENTLPDFFVKYVSFSPDQTKYILINNPEYFHEEAGVLVFDGGEPDVYVNVIDTTGKTVKQVMQCGTPCTFDDAVWIGDSAFIVAGSSENGMMEKTPAIWFFDLGTNKTQYFSYPTGVSYEVFGKNYDNVELMK
jgi:hypothetical protein